MLTVQNKVTALCFEVFISLIPSDSQIHALQRRKSKVAAENAISWIILLIKRSQ